MKFDKILEYQKVDQELLSLENEVAKSKEREVLFTSKKRIDTATDIIGKLSAESADLLASYTKMKSKIDALKQRLDEFDGVLEDVEDIGEADYYIKQINAIADEINALERDAMRDSARIDGINKDYKRTWEEGTNASESYKKAKQEYDKFINERQPKVAEITKMLSDLKEGIPKEFIEAYTALRAAKKIPAFVEYDPSSSVCGRCFMDVPNDTKGKLKQSGDYAECPNCRRILYIPEK